MIIVEVLRYVFFGFRIGRRGILEIFFEDGVRFGIILGGLFVVDIVFGVGGIG